MTDADDVASEAALVQRALAKLVARLERGEVSPADAVTYAFALGCETERADAMHRACKDYARTHAAREAAYGAVARGSSPPDSVRGP